MGKQGTVRRIGQANGLTNRRLAFKSQFTLFSRFEPYRRVMVLLKRPSEKKDAFWDKPVGKICLQEWSKILSAIIKSFIGSMPRRIAAVTKSKGDHTKY